MARWDNHVRKPNHCAVEGCDWVGYKRRVCPAHAMRRWRHGDYETVLPKGRPRGDDHARFWSKVECGADSECWLWTGAIQRRWGYGLVGIGGRTWLAHRFAYTITVAPIPADLLVCHHCDNPPCVNPSHLFLGTNADNNSDMERKGRSRHPSGKEHGTNTRPESVRRGERNGCARLTTEDVIEIRCRYAAGGITQTSLALEFGVHQGTISGIIRRTGWAHVA